MPDDADRACNHPEQRAYLRTGPGAGNAAGRTSNAAEGSGIATDLAGGQFGGLTDRPNSQRQLLAMDAKNPGARYRGPGFGWF